MERGFCVWFTGLSGSGKTTITRMLEQSLLERGLKVEVLDGDVVRTNLSKGLGFSREDRETNLLRIAFVADLLVRNGVIVLVAAITPFQNVRDAVRRQLGDYIEVFTNCPLEACIQRDVKGLYKKALAGEIKQFTGIDDPYDIPERPEVELFTHKESPEDSLARILLTLEMLGRIPPMPGNAYSEEDVALIQRRLAELGYI